MLSRILITSGPTREYLDPVRFLTNGSSGRMGVALAEAVAGRGGVPVVVSGPVALKYPTGTELHPIETTEQMLACCLELFPSCCGVIGAAAPCDFRPEHFSKQKLSKIKGNGEILFRFVETPDILAALGKIKRLNQWMIGFALETETENGKKHALEKLKRKNCDFIVLNSPASVNRETASVQIFDATGQLCAVLDSLKKAIAETLLALAETSFPKSFSLNILP